MGRSEMRLKEGTASLANVLEGEELLELGRGRQGTSGSSKGCPWMDTQEQ